jgi:hypothetical protein
VVTYPVVEHRSTRAGRWLRARRLRIAFVIAIVETLLVVTNVLGWFAVLAIATLVFAFYLFVGRKTRFDTLRQLSWTAAVSQLLPLTVPFVVLALGTLVLVAVIALLIVVGALLFLGRR